MVLCMICLSSCEDKIQSKEMIVVPEQGVRQNFATFSFALYLKTDKAPTPKSLIAQYSKKYPMLALSESDNPAKTSTRVMVFENAQVNAPPPTTASLKYFGRGLNEADTERIEKANVVLALDFRLENVKNYELQLSATQLMSDLASDFNGYIWDDESRLMFTKNFWDTKILPSWEKNTVIVEKNIAIHQYQEGEMLRSITLGMKKFGLPDLVVQNAPRNSSKSVVNTINVLSQTILENPKQPFNGRIELSLNGLRDSTFKASQISGLISNGTGTGAIFLEKAKPDEGDPDNLILALKFGDSNKTDQTIKQYTFFDRFFGSEDQLVRVNHNQELEDASNAAKSKLPGLQAKFNKGLPPGAMLMLKVPFTTREGGNEWMWIEVIEWSDTKIRGILQNDPQQVPGLKAGQQVTTKKAKVFDYIYYHSDGTKEGNETGKILEKMSH